MVRPDLHFALETADRFTNEKILIDFFFHAWFQIRLQSLSLFTLCCLLPTVLGAGGTLLTYTPTGGISSFVYAINQQSLSLFNFTSTYSSSLALIGNAILAAGGIILNVITNYIIFYKIYDPAVYIKLNY